jgi:hypothetical protein
MWFGRYWSGLRSARISIKEMRGFAGLTEGRASRLTASRTKALERLIFVGICCNASVSQHKACRSRPHNALSALALA